MERRTVLKEPFDKYWPEMYELVFTLINTSEKTEEIVADTFLALYRKLENEVMTEPNIRLFLSTTARNIALNFLKHSVYD